MKKTFVYELKRCLLPLVIFSAIAVVVSLIAVLGFSTRSASSGEYRLYRLDNAGIDVFTVLLCILCTVVPVMQFSYRMGQRSTDLWYSLPVSRRRLALVRVLVGLVMVFVPYTLAYLFGVLTIALRVTQESFVWYVPHFFLSLLLGAGLFGVNSFLFSRANRVMDGILFIAAWACILPLFLALVSGWADDTIFSYVVEDRTRYYKLWNACDSLFTYSPLAWTSAFFERLVVAKQPLNDGMCVNFALAVAVGVAEMAAAYTLLFVCADRDKSENADQISSSWWGYKVLIPAYRSSVWRRRLVDGAHLGRPARVGARAVLCLSPLLPPEKARRHRARGVLCGRSARRAAHGSCRRSAGVRHARPCDASRILITHSRSRRRGFAAAALTFLWTIKEKRRKYGERGG